MKTKTRNIPTPRRISPEERNEPPDRRVGAPERLRVEGKATVDTNPAPPALEDRAAGSRDQPLRHWLVEAMNEGVVALTGAADVVYANPAFARIVRCPADEAGSGPFTRFLPPEDSAELQAELRAAPSAGVKIPVMLRAADGSRVPVQLSARALMHDDPSGAKIGMVITDLSAVRRAEDLQRALTHRLVQSQEDERGRVALELHDNITQLLCATLFRSQALAEKLSQRGGGPESEAERIRDMLSQTAGQVERISHNLRSSVLNELGLIAVLRDTSREFARRTGLPVELDLAELSTRLPAATELALYRILQHTLANVEAHADAHHVTVSLKSLGGFVRLRITDDGHGFDLTRHEAGLAPAFGLLGMSERASFVGGTFEIKSEPRRGTVVQVSVPFAEPGVQQVRRG